MTAILNSTIKGRPPLFFIYILYILLFSVAGFARASAQATSDSKMPATMPMPAGAAKSTDTGLEKMPVDLETDFALSALPPHLRDGATVYLLDPKKGYYISRQGTNGFICYIERTSWEWAEFRNDLAAPISFDAEGARTIFPVVLEVARMRASGKYSPLQVKDSMIGRIQKGIYKAPARAGISYMLAPVMRVYTGNPDNNEVVSMTMPHYMFYAPYITNADVGILSHPTEGPFLVNPDGMILGENKGPHGFIILPANERQTAKIVSENKDLLKRLSDYKPYFAVNPGGMHH